MKKVRRVSLALGCGIGFVVFGLYWFGKLDGLELQSLDWRFRIRGPEKDPGQIAVVAIDEESIKRYGRWPWDRSLHAKLINRLTKAGARVIAFDVIFTEPQEKPGEDIALIEATRRSRRVVHEMFFDYGADRPVVFNMPLAGLERYALGLGSPNFIPSQDGVLRNEPLFFEHRKKLYPHISLVAAAAYLKKSPEDLALGVPSVESPLSVQDLAVSEMTVNFLGGFEAFPYHSYHRVLEGKVPAEALRDKLIFVGFKAAGLGLQDKVVTPFANLSAHMPGVECLANAAHTLINGKAIHPSNPGLTVLSILFLGTLLGWLLPHFTPLVSTFAALGIWGSYSLSSYLGFARGNLWFEWSAPTVVIALSYVSITLYRFMTEQKEKAWIKNTFSQYMSPKVIEVLQNSPEKLRLGGDDREMSIFFSDLAGFTSISEALTPEQLGRLMNEYLSEMSDIIMRYDGIIDKFIGDAIMAFWNAPIDQPDHPRRACLAAIEQLKRLDEMRVDFKRRGLPDINCRIGLSCGHVKVGNFGSKLRFDYTVMGDTVNLASRLEGANKPFHTRLMASEFIYERAKDAVMARELDLLQVKGKAKPIKVYELLGKNGDMPEEQKKALELYNEGLAFYHERAFKKAAEKFRKTAGLLPGDGPSQVYIERCENFMANPPPKNWDGVFVMTTK